ncbi:MAG: SGNH/GDSL hydrolase family protein [Planctomycetes bacterium]|nr:SGNH/GDSL hydrolase family protein [Planctomycetota bacterium]
MPFLVAELFLRAMGWGRAQDYSDPFVGFADIHPLFVRSDDGERYEIPPARQDFFRPDSFAAQKTADEFRIFCLGGSTVQGNPYGIETSFTTWLELSLQAADPGRSWEVVNCGGISYASYRLVPILEEVLGYEPDLIIVYSGHNEFLEDRTYEQIRRRPAWLAAANRAAIRSRLYNVARHALMEGTQDADPPELPAEVDAVLDHYGGLDEYDRDDARRDAIIADYELNLRRMIELAGAANVPVILCNPVSNLSHCPPFKSEHRDDLSANEQMQFDALWQKALAESEPARQEELLRQAVQLDPRHAAVRYHLAQVLELRRQYGKAKQQYVRAKDEDVCPLRMLEPMHAALFALAEEMRTPVVDVRRLIEAASPHGIPGEKLLIDHVHPRIRGHKMIAGALVEEMTRLGFVRPATGWTDERDQAYRRHVESLEYGYFVRGEEHLHGLRLWTQGRAKPKVKRNGH